MSAWSAAASQSQAGHAFSRGPVLRDLPWLHDRLRAASGTRSSRRARDRRGNQAGPAAEGAAEGAGLGEAEVRGDVAEGHAALDEIEGALVADGVDELAVGRALVAQAALEGARGDAEPAGGALDVDVAVAQLVADGGADFVEEAGRGELGEPGGGGGLEVGAELGLGGGERGREGIARE